MNIDKDLTFELRDEYNRKPVAEKIIKLLESDVDVSPMVIDGGWGTGKSEFCIKLINLLEAKEETDLRSIYVDAFKADHADEPLMTLLAAVLNLFPDAKEQKSLIDKALPAIRVGTKTVLKSGVSWLLKQDAADIAEDFEKDLKKAGDEIVNSTISSLLDDHVKADESIEALKDGLKELTKEKPIVIFIDELDRCRPNFAISILESIKHIFDIEGVQFVLIVNTEQLEASVNHCYGVSVDAQKYLDKFFGIKLSLSSVIDINAHKKKHASEEHFSNLVEKSNTLKESILIYKDKAASGFTSQLININDLSLREVEKFVKYLEIYHELTDKKGLADNLIFGFGLLRIYGIYLYCFKQEIICNTK